MQRAQPRRPAPCYRRQQVSNLRAPLNIVMSGIGETLGCCHFHLISFAGKPSLPNVGTSSQDYSHFLDELGNLFRCQHLHTP